MSKIGILIHSRKGENIQGFGFRQMLGCSNLIPVFEEMTFDCFDLFDFLLTLLFFLLVMCFFLKIAHRLALSILFRFNYLQIFLVFKCFYVIQVNELRVPKTEQLSLLLAAL